MMVALPGKNQMLLACTQCMEELTTSDFVQVTAFAALHRGPHDKPPPKTLQVEIEDDPPATGLNDPPAKQP